MAISLRVAVGEEEEVVAQTGDEVDTMETDGGIETGEMQSDAISMIDETVMRFMVVGQVVEVEEIDMRGTIGKGIEIGVSVLVRP